MAATKHLRPSPAQLPKRPTSKSTSTTSTTTLKTVRRKPTSKPAKTTSLQSHHFPQPTSSFPRNPPRTPTAYQSLVYAHLLLIPAGRVTSYALLSKTLDSSPRAVGGALRCNPFAPDVPCHRVIAATGFVGGFKGDWEKAPSGVNQTLKLELLAGEGVVFDGQGRLIGPGDGEDVWFDGPWDGLDEAVADVQRRVEKQASGGTG